MPTLSCAVSKGAGNDLLNATWSFLGEKPPRRCVIRLLFLIEMESASSGLSDPSHSPKGAFGGAR